MTAARTPARTGFWHLAWLVAATSLVASCTTSTDNLLAVNSPSFAASTVAVAAGADAAPAAIDGEIPPAPPASDADGAVATQILPGETSLPEAVAYVPTANPAGVAMAQVEPKAAGATAPAVAEPVAEGAPPSTDGQVVAAAGPTTPQYFLTNPDPTAAPPAPKKRGFLTNLFGATPAGATPLRATRPAPEAQPEKPLVQLASVGSAEKPVGASAFVGGGGEALPGVRQSALFEIKRKSGLDDDSDVDLHEEDGDGGLYQVASAAGLARLAPNGLLKQTDNVDVACLKPSLVRTLKAVERHYGRKIMVTSGYRNPDRNRRARGAKNSLHMYCAAADVQVPGISKWELANFVRSMPGRGGVGTYCHTNSVHIDVGPERDWNWRCRGKRKKRA
ncbi:MAG: YcbK family protein [Rhizobiaceae bacterium]